MMISVAVIIAVGLLFGFFASRVKMPPLVGMLIGGILVGPSALNWLDDSMLAISTDIRRITLIIVLLRAGLGLNRKTLQKIGKPAAFMSTVPVVFEGLFVALMVIILFDFSFVQGGMTGFMIAAVSPAVIVPSMLALMKKGVGKKNHAPSVILASASVDDVIAITVFSMFVGISTATSINVALQIFSIPLSILLGVVLGLMVGFAMLFLFNRFKIRDSKKVIMLLSASIFMVALADWLEGTLAIAALLGVMVLGIVMIEKKPPLGERLSRKFDKVWVIAEVFLFVLVGAAVDPMVALEVGLIGIVIVLSGLIVRSLAVLLVTQRSMFSLRERTFFVMAFLPKATVQASIGGLPLTLGIAGGEKMLALAVISILLSAPLGAILIDVFSEKLLKEDGVSS